MTRAALARCCGTRRCCCPEARCSSATSPPGSAGLPTLGVLPEPPALPAAEFDRARREHRAVVLDARAPEAFGVGHVPGALSLGLGPSFSTWAGRLLPADARILLVLDDPADLWEATWQLLRIGYDPPAGWLAGGMQAWRTSGRPVDYLPQLTPAELRTEPESGSVRVLDVRQPSGWAAGHIDGAIHITGAELPERQGELGTAGQSEVPLAVVCGSGYRSTAAASLLAAQGNGQVFNVVGKLCARLFSRPRFARDPLEVVRVAVLDGSRTDAGYFVAVLLFRSSDDLGDERLARME